MRARIPVLMYHWVDDDPGNHLRFYGVLPETFRRQMEMLAAAGMNCLALDDLAVLLEEGSPLPPRSFVLTFDDGYVDLESTVLPVLERHSFTATVFVVTDRAGGVNEWDAKHGDPPRPLLDWEAVRRLDGGVFRFESHSCTHPFLTCVDRDAARREIFDSRRRLEDQLGREVRIFSYPHGLFDADVEETVREAGYRAAATDIRGRNREGLDPFRIRRVMVTLPDGPAGFRFKVRTGHDLRSASRALLGLQTGAPEGGGRQWW